MRRQGNIYLTGFMATGKTTLGRELARKLGRPFLDLDELIETEAGRSIPEIFKAQGEEGFRELERACLRRVVSLQATVVAVGGGAVTNPENRRLMRQSGLVVRLKADPEEILRRLATSKTARPLLPTDNPAPRVFHLLAEREEAYRDADLEVETTGRRPAEMVDEIGHRLPFPTGRVDPQGEGLEERLTIQVAGGSYPIVFGSSLLAKAERQFSSFPRAARAAIVTNPLVKCMYGAGLRHSLTRAGFNCLFVVVPEGERTKTLHWASHIYDILAEQGFSRGDLLVALGGGVVGDLGGFVAATFMRGIPFVQAPTTLLAQVDASVGGKTAVNHPRAKNLIGCFYQPKLCLLDLDTLQTLPEEIYAEGFAEVIKYGLLEGGDFLRRLARDREALLSRDTRALGWVVSRCVAIKARYVQADERDTGIRMSLNLGHTLAHALENVLGYSGLRHGEAVSLGLVWCTRLAASLGLLRERTARDVASLLADFGLPTRLPDGLDPTVLLEPMGLDKKVAGGRLRLVLPLAGGETTIRDDLPISLIVASIAALRDDV